VLATYSIILYTGIVMRNDTPDRARSRTKVQVIFQLPSRLHSTFTIACKRDWGASVSRVLQSLLANLSVLAVDHVEILVELSRLIERDLRLWISDIERLQESLDNVIVNGVNLAQQLEVSSEDSATYNAEVRSSRNPAHSILDGECDSRINFQCMAFFRDSLRSHSDDLEIPYAEILRRLMHLLIISEQDTVYLIINSGSEIIQEYPWNYGVKDSETILLELFEPDEYVSRLKSWVGSLREIRSSIDQLLNVVIEAQQNFAKYNYQSQSTAGRNE